MELTIDFPGGSRVDAHFGLFTVQTDQPPAGTAPTPFDMFLASIGTCAGIYVLGFCNQRHLRAGGISIIEKVSWNPMSGMVDKISLEIKLPPGFPEKYRQAVINSAQRCAVKKHLEHPPAFQITTSLN
jgi:putative redox protein